MVGTPAKDLSFDDAKKGVIHIISIINEFLESVEKIEPDKGYGKLASALASLDDKVQKSSAAFLSEKDVNYTIDALFFTFTRIHPNIEKNLADLFEAVKEIASFLDQNNGAFDFNLLNFDNEIIKKMRDITNYTNKILPELKQKNYSDISGLTALMQNHSSRVETAVKAFLNELTLYRDKINDYSRSHGQSYQAFFDPVTIMGIRGTVLKNDGRYYTLPTAIRHLIDHHHYEITESPCSIHFKSPINDPAWKFSYDKTFTCEDFFNFVAEIDAFCKSAVCLLFTFQLLAILRHKFQV